MLDIEYAHPMQFSYWAPLGSGGFVVSNIEQHTEFNFEANVRYIQAAERTGFDYALMPLGTSSATAGRRSSKPSRPARV
jgi:hypothetical protein